jgi:cell division protein FtsQ
VAESSDSTRTPRRNDFARRRNRQRLVKRLKIGAGLTVGLLLIQVFYFSSTFAVTKISVVGNHFAKPEDVIKAAAIEIGTPLAKLDTDGIARRVIALPAVGQVEIRRAWPHDVVLAITEPTPVAIVGSGNNWQYVDDEGAIFGTLRSKPRGFLTLTAAKTAARKAAAEVATTLPSWLKSQVAYVKATSPDDVQLKLQGGLTVRWGSSERADRKAQVLKALLTVKARVYDVSAPDVPITIK